MENKILEKIRKMVELLESEKKLGNIEAATNMAAIVQRMLLKHNLSLDDVDTGEYGDYTTLVFIPEPEHAVMERVAWQEELAFVVAKAHLCRALVMPRSNMQGFAGRKQDVEVAVYMYSVLLNAAVDIAHTAHEAAATRMYNYHGYPRSTGILDNRMRGFEKSFYVGFVVAITKKYQDTAEYVAAEYSSSKEPSTGLMRLQGQLTKVDKYLHDLYDKEGVEMPTADAIKEMVNDPSGFMQGYEAGRNTMVRKALREEKDNVD